MAKPPAQNDRMKGATLGRAAWCVALFLGTLLLPSPACAQGDWEITRESEQALARGLEWLVRTQGPQGNWESNDLGLVSTGALAFLAAGHLPGRGKHGETVQRALDYVMHNAQSSGLLNVSEPRRGMYNHGLSTFVLGQAYGMSGDRRLSAILDRALKLEAQTQCGDGGWDYVALRQDRGHDLSLAVMQALALRSAVDSGLEVPPEVVELAIKSVREHYTPQGCAHNAPEEEQRKHPGQFSYSIGGGNQTIAMAAAGVVCLQEFGQYDDWRIEKSMQVIGKAILSPEMERATKDKRIHFDPYTLYYVAQALYQVGGQNWQQCYPVLRANLIASQVQDPSNPARDGIWTSSGHVGGRPGELYATSVGCFVLAIPNRFLPILQEGKIDSLRAKFGQGQKDGAKK